MLVNRRRECIGIRGEEHVGQEGRAVSNLAWCLRVRGWELEFGERASTGALEELYFD